MSIEKTKPLISAEICHEIDAWLIKYPPDQKRSALLIALRLVQEENDGWLTNDHIEAVADYLGIPHIAAYEAATFYSMFELEPVGRHKICVCEKISCMLRGAENIMVHLESRLGIKRGETTPDGKYTLKGVDCLAACCGAPMLQLDDKEIIENLTKEKVDQLLARLEDEMREEELK